MASPKTTAVVFKNGTEGRGVKLSLKNQGAVALWIGNDLYQAGSVTGVIRLYQNGGGQVRVAKIGDTIVKTKAGFTVIKAADFAKYIKI